MLANLKIWTRLSLGFFVVILLLIAVVGLVIHSNAGLKANTEAIGRDRYPKIEIAQKWIVSILQIARHSDNIFILPKEQLAEEAFLRLAEAHLRRIAQHVEVEHIAGRAAGEQGIPGKTGVNPEHGEGQGAVQRDSQCPQHLRRSRE